MVHILIQCQVDDDTVNALQESGLADEQKFVNLLDQLEDFEDKVPSSKFDHLVIAATWMKEKNNIPSTSYKSEFTNEVLTSQLNLLHEKKRSRETGTRTEKCRKMATYPLFMWYEGRWKRPPESV